MTRSTPLTDSVWFWVALFAASGLLFTALGAPRALERREQLMGRFYARQLGGQAVMSQDAAQGRIGPLDEVAGGGSTFFVPIVVILTSALGVASWQLACRRPRTVSGSRHPE